MEPIEYTDALARAFIAGVNVYGDEDDALTIRGALAGDVDAQALIVKWATDDARRRRDHTPWP